MLPHAPKLLRLRGCQQVVTDGGPGEECLPHGVGVQRPLTLALLQNHPEVFV